MDALHSMTTDEVRACLRGWETVECYAKAGLDGRTDLLACEKAAADATAYADECRAALLERD